jgi:hypothetical protein
MSQDQMGYYDRLQLFIEVLKTLQASPIPEDEAAQELNLKRLGWAENEVYAILMSLPRVNTPSSAGEAPVVL